MAILAILIDDFACTATWGEAGALNTTDPATVSPRILLSSQILLGRTSEEVGHWNIAVVPGLTENLDALTTRANWALGSSFKRVGLKEALDQAVDLPAYLLALIQTCLKLAGPDRGITSVRLTFTLRPPKALVEKLEKILQKEDSPSELAALWAELPEEWNKVQQGLREVLQGLGKVLQGVKFELGDEALKLAIEGGLEMFSPEAGGPPWPQFAKNSVIGAVALWRDGFTAQLYNDGEFKPSAPVTQAVTNFVSIDLMRGAKDGLGVFAAMVSGAMMQPVRALEGSHLENKFDDDVVRTPDPRTQSSDPATNHEPRRRAFVKKFHSGATLNASQIVLAGALFLDDRVSRSLAPTAEEDGRANALLDSKDCRLNYALGYDSTDETTCWNRSRPLLGVGVVLRELLRKPVINATGRANGHQDAGSGAREVKKLLLDDQGKHLVKDQDLKDALNLDASIVLIHGQPSDRGKEIVLEARKREDGSWWLTAHLQERHLRIELKPTNEGEAQLSLHSGGRYLYTPDPSAQKKLSALQHLAHEGLVLFHPNSNPLLPQRHE